MAIQQIIAALKAPGGGGGGTLRDEILADGPAFYFRLNDLSGTTAVNETGGTSGTYSGSPVLNQPALYTGGPVCVRMPNATDAMTIPAALLSSTSTITLGIILKPTTVVSGVQSIFSKDPGSNREWQWRMNGANLEWVKIQAGVETKTATSVFVANTACILHVVISGTSIVMYKNGVSVLSTTIGSTTYGNLGSNFGIGYQAGPGTGLADAQVSEAFCCATALSAARVAAHATAAGF